MLEPGAFFEVADGELDRAWSRWNWSTATTGSSTSVMNAWCRQSGHSRRLGGIGEPGAAHDQAQPRVDACRCR